MANEPKAKRVNGLKYFKRATGKVPYWVADEECVKAGYPVKTANLSFWANDPVAIEARCARLQSEMLMWKSGKALTREYDGRFDSLLDIYETDKKSTFWKLKPKGRGVYSVYLRRLRKHIGPLSVDETDGRDVMGWFSIWAAQEDPDKPRSPYKHLPRGRMVLAVLKAAVSFGVACRYRGLAEFQAVLEQLEFPSCKARDKAPTREQMTAAVDVAISAGAIGRALAYAIQFDTTIRQTDIIGEWVDLDDERKSSVIDKGRKWIGPDWKQVSDGLVFSLTHGKTEETSGARGVYDLSVCPLVMKVLALIPLEKRTGPLVTNEDSGLPYRYQRFYEAWKDDYEKAGMPEGTWNRDTRAGGNTEAQDKGARLEDRKKVIGHTKDSPTTAKVYDRGALEAHRRVMQARTASGNSGQSDQ